MQVKIKRLHPDAIIPSYAKEGDAGLDLIATDDGNATDYGTVMFGTGLSVQIPKGYVGLVFPRSSIYKSTGRLANCVGVIDSGYRGELMVNMDISLMSYAVQKEDVQGYKAISYKKGDKIAQLIIMPYPQIKFTEVIDELEASDRGVGGFGSTDN